MRSSKRKLAQTEVDSDDTLKLYASQFRRDYLADPPSAGVS